MGTYRTSVLLAIVVLGISSVSPLNGDSCAHICVSYFSDRTVFPTLSTLCRCVSYFSDRIVFPTLPSLCRRVDKCLETVEVMYLLVTNIWCRLIFH